MNVLVDIANKMKEGQISKLEALQAFQNLNTLYMPKSPKVVSSFKASPNSDKQHSSAISNQVEESLCLKKISPKNSSNEEKLINNNSNQYEIDNSFEEYQNDQDVNIKYSSEKQNKEQNKSFDIEQFLEEFNQKKIIFQNSNESIRYNNSNEQQSKSNFNLSDNLFKRSGSLFSNSQPPVSLFNEEIIQDNKYINENCIKQQSNEQCRKRQNRSLNDLCKDKVKPQTQSKLNKISESKQKEEQRHLLFRPQVIQNQKKYEGVKSKLGLDKSISDYIEDQRQNKLMKEEYQIYVQEQKEVQKSREYTFKPELNSTKKYRPLSNSSINISGSVTSRTNESSQNEMAMISQKNGQIYKKSQLNVKEMENIESKIEKQQPKINFIDIQKIKKQQLIQDIKQLDISIQYNNKENVHISENNSILNQNEFQRSINIQTEQHQQLPYSYRLLLENNQSNQRQKSLLKLFNSNQQGLLQKIKSQELNILERRRIENKQKNEILLEKLQQKQKQKLLELQEIEQNQIKLEKDETIQKQLEQNNNINNSTISKTEVIFTEDNDDQYDQNFDFDQLQQTNPKNSKSPKRLSSSGNLIDFTIRSLSLTYSQMNIEE